MPSILILLFPFHLGNTSWAILMELEGDRDGGWGSGWGRVQLLEGSNTHERGD